MSARADGGASHSAGATGAVTRSTVTSAGTGNARSARSYWARCSASVSDSCGGSFAR